MVLYKKYLGYNILNFTDPTAITEFYHNVCFIVDVCPCISGNIFALPSGLSNSLDLHMQDLQTVTIPSNQFHEITANHSGHHVRPITVTVIPRGDDPEDVDTTQNHADLDETDYAMDMMVVSDAT